MAILSKMVLATAVGTGVAETLLRTKTKSPKCSAAEDSVIKCSSTSGTILDASLLKCTTTVGATSSACKDACCVDATKAADDDLCKKYDKTKTTFKKDNKVKMGTSSSFLQSSLACSNKIDSLAGKENSASSVTADDIQSILKTCCEEAAADKGYYSKSTSGFYR